MFKKAVLMGVFSVLGAGLMVTSSPSFAADADFVLVNRTGYPLDQVYVSPANKKSWGRDRLGSYQMANNTSRKFTFGDTKNCIQDIKVVFADDDSEVEWEDFNLCELDKITLRYNRKTGDVSADTE